MQVWEAAGHDGGLDESDRLRGLTLSFLDRYLKGSTRAPTLPGLDVTVPDAVVSSIDSNPAPQRRTLGAVPGTGANPPVRLDRLPLTGPEQLAIAPPGGVPAALSSLPGLSGALGLLGGAGVGGASLGGQDGGQDGGQSADAGQAGAGDVGGTGLTGNVLPGQVATFETAPLRAPRTLVGSARVSVRVRSTAKDATMFASLLDVAPDGSSTLPERLVAPVHLSALPAAGEQVTIVLPAVVHDVPAGHRLRVVLATTDQAYALPADARGYQIALAGDRALSLPDVPLRAEPDDSTTVLLLVAAGMLALVLLGGLALAVRGAARRRRAQAAADPQLAGVPLSIAGLGKAYGDGFRAVSDLTLRVEPGQVLGLLGPNGAGKTTTLRMLVGLILPTEGSVRIFGHPVGPGAPVLSRVGAFIEGPGFLPHLSGRANLELYWQATGRPAEESHLAEALEVAGLGEDLERKVRTYSHGMKQRLGIAQAMLGLPELLVMDEPTNGLDPPQIREMRDVLAGYVATGRTVVVSSHLLSEVEQTCTHVAVMQGGRLVAHGPVSELVGAASALVVDVDDPDRAARLARVVDGVHDVEQTPTGLVVRATAPARAELVRTLVIAGVRVDRVAPRRGLEETFLALVGES
jgi:ABC-2 type transport system ATP-binding protein